MVCENGVCHIGAKGKFSFKINSTLQQNQPDFSLDVRPIGESRSAHQRSRSLMRHSRAESFDENTDVEDLMSPAKARQEAWRDTVDSDSFADKEEYDFRPKFVYQPKMTLPNQPRSIDMCSVSTNEFGLRRTESAAEFETCPLQASRHISQMHRTSTRLFSRLRMRGFIPLKKEEGDDGSVRFFKSSTNSLAQSEADCVSRASITTQPRRSQTRENLSSSSLPAFLPFDGKMKSRKPSNLLIGEKSGEDRKVEVNWSSFNYE